MSGSTTPRPRRAAEEPRRSRTPLVVGAATVGALAVAIGALAVNHAGNSADGSESSAGTSCTAPARIAVDPAWAQAVTTVAKSWSEENSNNCALSVDTRDSGQVAASGLGEDQAWIPEDTPWFSRAKDTSLSQGNQQKLGSSQFVLALPADAQDALGSSLSGDTLRSLVSNQKTWAQYGHPEWGWFKLVIPSIDDSMAGPVGYGTLQGVVGGGASAAGTYYNTDPHQVDMARLQQRVVAQVDTAEVMRHLAVNPQDANGFTKAGPRAGLTTEYLALQADGVKATPLAPGAGLTMAIVNPSDDATVRSFVQWLGSDEGQRRLANAGVSNPGHRPPAPELNQLGVPQQATEVRQNDAGGIDQVRSTYASYSRRHSLMMVLDTSGSMGQKVPGGYRRVDLLTQQLVKSWGTWPVGMSWGVMTFNADLKSNAAQIRTVVPLQPDNTEQWQQTRLKLRENFRTMPVEGGTPLYEAIAKGYRYNKEHYQAGKENMVIVVTDGRNEDSTSTMTLQQLLRTLPSQPDADKPVRLLLVGLGKDADMATLNRIAQATHQQAVRIDQPSQLSAGIERYVASV